MAYMGQLGNQLTQYCVAKILAAKTGQAFFPGPWLAKDGRPLNWHVEPFLIPLPTDGDRDGVGTWFIDCQHWANLDEVPRGWNVDAKGFFQRAAMFGPYKDRIRNDWLRIDPSRFVKTDPHAVYIHVRRTDYLGDDLSPERNCQATTLAEYAACVRRFPGIKKAVLVSDDYKDAFLAKLAVALFCEMGFDDVIVGAAQQTTWDADFLTLASCRNLIMSQSTFSWWAGFLGRAERIVCPVFPNTFWGNGVGLIGPPKDGRDFPNLFVDDDGPEKQWEWVTA